MWTWIVTASLLLALVLVFAATAVRQRRQPGNGGVAVARHPGRNRTRPGNPA